MSSFSRRVGFTVRNASLAARRQSKRGSGRLAGLERLESRVVRAADLGFAAAGVDDRPTADDAVVSNDHSRTAFEEADVLTGVKWQRSLAPDRLITRAASVVSAAPTELRTSAIRQDSFTLSWKRPAGSINRFEVWVKNNGAWKRSENVPGDRRSAVIEYQWSNGPRLKPGETYDVRMRSIDGSGRTSDWSAVTRVTMAGNAPAHPSQSNPWTILVYMTGDDLNTFASEDINEMEKALASMPAGVRIVVGWDQPSSPQEVAFSTGGGSQSAWRTFGRSVLQADPDVTSIASTFDLSLGEKNTGDPATLVDFVTWGIKQAPAERYVLQMWGHGRGFHGSQFDPESGSDALTIGEFTSALRTQGMPTFDLVSYDNCLMGMAEVGFAIAPLVRGMFVASEENVNGSGQNYVTAYNALKVPNPKMVTASDIASSMVASFQQQYHNDQNNTFSAAVTNRYAALASTLKRFVDSTATLSPAHRRTMTTAAMDLPTYGDSEPFGDLGSFMQNVSAEMSLPQAVRSAAQAAGQAISSLIVAKTDDQGSSSGLSVYLPTDPVEFSQSYLTSASAFCQATGWHNFARWLATGSRSASPKVTAGAQRIVTTLAAPKQAGREVPPAVWAAIAASGSQASSPAGLPRRSRL